MNINEMSTRDLCFKWKPYAEQLGKAVKTYLNDRGETKIGRWDMVLKLNPDLAVELGIDLSQPLAKPVLTALSFFYAYHVTGERKERDSKRRAKDRQSTPEQRAMWREQKRESLARLAAGERRKVHHTRVKPIIARREDLDMPYISAAVNPVPEASNGAGLRGSLLRTIEQLQSLLKAIE